MHRRQLLAGGGLAVVSVLAGCAGDIPTVYFPQTTTFSVTNRTEYTVKVSATYRFGGETHPIEMTVSPEQNKTEQIGLSTTERLSSLVKVDARVSVGDVASIIEQSWRPDDPHETAVELYVEGKNDVYINRWQD